MHGQPREYVTSQSCNSFKAKELQCTSVKEENKKISVLFLTFVSFSNGCTFFFFFFWPVSHEETVKMRAVDLPVLDLHKD